MRLRHLAALVCFSTATMFAQWILPSGGAGGGGSSTTVTDPYPTFTVCPAAGCVLSETTNWRKVAASAHTVTAIKCVVGFQPNTTTAAAPTLTDVIVEIYKNAGTAIIGGSHLTIAVGVATVVTVSSFASASVAAGDTLYAQITQADTGGAAQFVSCTVVW